MPSGQSPSQPQTRPALGKHTSTNSVHSQTDSPSTTPPQHGGKPKTQKHVVGGGRAHGHARVPSAKGLHKLTKAHGAEGSHTDLKKLARNASSTTLKKNSSHVSLKRNRSSADVEKKFKAEQEKDKRPASVHFEIGDQDEAWESSSASPALSRSVSKSAGTSGQSSAKHSTTNSQVPSPLGSPPGVKHKPAPLGNGDERRALRHSTDAKGITERLLQRTLSQNTTKMSLATATPSTPQSTYSPDSQDKTQASTRIGTPNEVVSRFVGEPDTPSESSPFLPDHRSPNKPPEDIKRAQSMGNLTRADRERDDDEESVLAPRSRKSSTGHAYAPSQQSRTQQKLWLQRASSNIEPQQMAPPLARNGLGGHGLGGTSLVGGAGYDGRDPRIKAQLERTGLEYLVVRRHQDPVLQALKRLSQLPGAEKYRRIPAGMKNGANGGHHGLSQSLKESRRGKDKVAASGANSSFEGRPGSLDDGASERGEEGNDAGAILRTMWDRGFDLSASAD